MDIIHLLIQTLREDDVRGARAIIEQQDETDIHILIKYLGNINNINSVNNNDNINYDFDRKVYVSLVSCY